MAAILNIDEYLYSEARQWSPLHKTRSGVAMNHMWAWLLSGKAGSMAPSNCYGETGETFSCRGDHYFCQTKHDCLLFIDYRDDVINI